jgi:hypothetical protein
VHREEKMRASEWLVAIAAMTVWRLAVGSGWLLMVAGGWCSAAMMMMMVVVVVVVDDH